MPNSVRLEAESVLVQVSSAPDAAFLAAAIELGLRRRRADGSVLPIDAQRWAAVVDDLRPLFALPTSESVVSPTSSRAAP